MRAGRIGDGRAAGFEVAFEITGLFGEADEFEHVRITDEIEDARRGFASLLAGVVDGGLFIRRKSGALVEQRADLSLKLALGPVGFEAFVLVEGTLPGIVDPDELQQG